VESTDGPLRVRIVFEYDWITYRIPNFGSVPESVREKFNALGYDGWEIVNEVLVEADQFSNVYRALFKRTKIIEEA